MAANFQWATGFENLRNSPSTITNGTDEPTNFIGWETETTFPGSGKNGVSYFTSVAGTGFLRGTAAYVRTNISCRISPYTSEGRIFRTVTDNAKMCLGFALKLESNGADRKDLLGFGLVNSGTDSIRFRLFRDTGTNTWVSSLWINGAKVGQGTIDLGTGAAYSWIELFVNKTAGTVLLKVNGVPDCTGTMPVGFVAQEAEIRELNSGSPSLYAPDSNVIIDDIVFYDNSDPIGVLKVDGYIKTGDVLTGFTDGTDAGTLVTNNINTCSYKPYRACSVAGSEDKFSYNNILPAGVVATNIFAVTLEYLVSSGSYINGNIESVLNSGATTVVNDMTSKAQPFNPRYVKAAVIHNDPDTGVAWTRSGVQAINVGYRVKV